MAAASLLLQRTLDDGVQSLGNLFALNADGVALNGWVTVERPWRDNEFRKSCIPPGRYFVVHRWSQKFGHHLHVTDVDGRSWILIHAGNDWSDIVGCIAPGRYFGHGAGDHRLDVLTSSTSLAELRALVPTGGCWMEVYAPPVRGFAVQHSAGIPETPSRLARGAKGNAVRALQLELIKRGHVNPPADGVFGPNTERAVKDFQRRESLAVDGVGGPDTLGALGLS